MGSNGLIHWRGRTPLSRHVAFATDDPGLAEVGGTRLLGAHRLRVLDDGVGFRARVNARRWQDVMIAHFSYSAALQVVSRPLADIFAINLPLSGRANVRYRGARIDSSPSSAAVVFSPTESASMRWSADYTVLCVTVRRTALERHLSRMLGSSMEEGLHFGPDMSIQERGASWCGTTQLLLDLAERAAPSEQSPLVTADMESAVMTTLLLVQPHNYSAALLDDPPPTSSRTVNRAVEIMHAESGAPLTVARVAERAGVSERSLQLAFRRRLGTSPSEYLRSLRLDRARRALLATPPEERAVSRIATECGFFHLGRFAAVYRKKFGENPSQTGRG